MGRVVNPELESLISHTLGEPVESEHRGLMFDLIEAGVAPGLYCSLSGHIQSVM